MKKAIRKSVKSLWQSTPLIIGILLFVSLINSFLNKGIYSRIFSHNGFINSIVGALAGSLSGGSPVNSYILGGEFLKQGVSLTAVTAFLVSWVTVGLIQIPVEGKFLGMRFALWRNASAFVLSIFAAVITTILIKI